jgi:DUF4097 and DUF4098 domain-containing protein YvlB
VIYDFEIKVPAATMLRLATINGGEVRVDNTTGDFDVANVNGGIEMNEVAGSGPVHTVNGRISVVFSKNPTKDSSFKSVNGTIEASFRPGLSADVRVKTFNGHAYTDFDATPLPSLTPSPSAARANSSIVATVPPACASAAAGPSSSSTR